MLPPKIIDAVRSAYHTAAFETACDMEEEAEFLNAILPDSPTADFNFPSTLKQQEYISDHRISRMTPQEILDVYLDCDPRFPSCNDLVQLLSDVTGRTPADLSDAIFGTGSYDPCALPPSPDALKFMQFYFSNYGEMSNEDFCKGLMDVLRDVPDDAFHEVLQEVKDYMIYYRDHELPDYLTSPD